MKYPIGIQTFEKLRQEGCVYVDKTAMVHSLAKGGTIYFLSRPRRFGKSLLLSTLKSYHFCKDAVGVYNPFSLLNAFKKRSVEDYWFRSDTPTYLFNLLARCDENLNELVGKYYAQSDFEDYRATAQRPLPMSTRAATSPSRATSARGGGSCSTFPTWR